MFSYKLHSCQHCLCWCNHIRSYGYTLDICMETIHMSTYTLSVHNAHTCVHYTHSNTCIYTSYIHVYIHSMCTTVHNVQTTYTCYTYTLGTIHMHTYVYKSHTFVMYEILDKCAHNTYTRIHILKWVRQTQTGLMISQKEPCHFNVVTAWSALWHRYWHTNISSYYYLLYWHICHQLILTMTHIPTCMLIPGRATNTTMRQIMTTSKRPEFIRLTIIQFVCCTSLYSLHSSYTWLRSSAVVATVWCDSIISMYLTTQLWQSNLHYMYDCHMIVTWQLHE